MRLRHIEHRAQFQWVMAGPPVVKTAHFALHMAAAPAPVGPMAQTGAPPRPLFAGAGPWVGVVIPKRWAKRAVTRNLMKRQIYALAQERQQALPRAALVVRLRSGFDRQQFISAASDALKIAVRTELQQLYGRLLERKGFQEAIAAFSQVIQTYPDCTLTIFGEGPFRKNLETQIQHLGLSHSVFLPGKISNPMDLLVSNGKEHPTSDIGHPTSFHCFLFSSWYEGFSGALVEAMMAGIPIIASDIPMNLEAVTDSKTALIFKVGDSQDLFEKMTFALEHPEQMAAMGQEARREAEERFDIEKIAREYERVVRSLAPPRP